MFAIYIYISQLHIYLYIDVNYLTCFGNGYLKAVSLIRSVLPFHTHLSLPSNSYLIISLWKSLTNVCNKYLPITLVFLPISTESDVYLCLRHDQVSSPTLDVNVVNTYVTSTVSDVYLHLHHDITVIINSSHLLYNLILTTHSHNKPIATQAIFTQTLIDSSPYTLQIHKLLANGTIICISMIAPSLLPISLFQYPTPNTSSNYQLIITTPSHTLILAGSSY